MSLIVEDGTGMSTADSYISVADADTYHSSMGNTAWPLATEGAREIALRRATQYLDTHYRWRGSPLSSTQALAWPRDYAAWPVAAVRVACSELALRALSASLLEDVTDQTIKQETVGPITTVFFDPTQGGQTRFALVDSLVAPLTGGGGWSSLRIERA